MGNVLQIQGGVNYPVGIMPIPTPTVYVDQTIPGNTTNLLAAFAPDPDGGTPRIPVFEYGALSQRGLDLKPFGNTMKGMRSSTFRSLSQIVMGANEICMKMENSGCVIFPVKLEDHGGPSSWRLTNYGDGMSFALAEFDWELSGINLLIELFDDDTMSVASVTTGFEYGGMLATQTGLLVNDSVGAYYDFHLENVRGGVKGVPQGPGGTIVHIAMAFADMVYMSGAYDDEDILPLMVGIDNSFYYELEVLDGRLVMPRIEGYSGFTQCSVFSKDHYPPSSCPYENSSVSPHGLFVMACEGGPRNQGCVTMRMGSPKDHNGPWPLPRYVRNYLWYPFIRGIRSAVLS